MAYNSSYTGTQIDTAIGAVQTAANAGGIVNTNGLTSILGNYLTTSNAASTYAPLTGTGTSGTWPISISGSSTSCTGNAATATYSAKTTYLYADNSPYRYGDDSPYYAHMTYHTNGDYRWYLRVYPETPKEIAVDYAYNAGNAMAVSTCTANGDNVAAMKSVWNSLPTNKTLGVYIAHGSASFFYGWRLAGYSVGSAYGGGVIDNYGSPQYLNVSAGTFTLNYISQTSGSSKYIKTNISPMTLDEAKKLLNINCVKYDYIDGYGGNNNYGAIAEDMEKIIPYAVHKAANYDMNNPNTRMNIYIDYQRLVPYLIKMVQIQEEEIKTLQLRITNLEGQGAECHS